MLRTSDESKEILFGNYLTLNEIELSRSVINDFKMEKKRTILSQILKKETSTINLFFYYIETLKEKDLLVSDREMDFIELKMVLEKEKLNLSADLITKMGISEENFKYIQKLFQNQNIFGFLILRILFKQLTSNERIKILNFYLIFFKESIERDDEFINFNFQIFNFLEIKNEIELKIFDQILDLFEKIDFNIIKYIHNESIINYIFDKKEDDNFMNQLKHFILKNKNEHLFEFILNDEEFLSQEFKLDQFDTLKCLFYILNFSNFDLIDSNKIEIHNLINEVNNEIGFKFILKNIFERFISLKLLIEKLNLNEEKMIKELTNESLLKILIKYNMINDEEFILNDYLKNENEKKLFKDYLISKDILNQILNNGYQEEGNNEIILNQNIFISLKYLIKRNSKLIHFDSFERFINICLESSKIDDWFINELIELKWKLKFLTDLNNDVKYLFSNSFEMDMYQLCLKNNNTNKLNELKEKYDLKQEEDLIRFINNLKNNLKNEIKKEREDKLITFQNFITKISNEENLIKRIEILLLNKKYDESNELCLNYLNMNLIEFILKRNNDLLSNSKIIEYLKKEKDSLINHILINNESNSFFEHFNHLSKWKSLNNDLNISFNQSFSNNQIISNNELTILNLFKERRNIHELKRIKDKNQLYSFILNNLYLFNDINDLIDLFKICYSYLKSKEIKQTLNEFELYRDILKILNENDWMKFKEYNLNEKLIINLLELNEFNLSRNILNYFNDDDNTIKVLRFRIEIDNLLHLILNKEWNLNNSIDIRNLLISIKNEKEFSILICQRVLELLNNLKQKIYFYDFIILNLNLNNIELNEFKSNQLGLKILNQLDLIHREKFDHLKRYPNLIFENLIILEEINLVKKILDELPELHNEELFIHYGKKALEFINDDVQQNEQEYEQEEEQEEEDDDDDYDDDDDDEYTETILRTVLFAVKSTFKKKEKRKRIEKKEEIIFSGDYEMDLKIKQNFNFSKRTSSTVLLSISIFMLCKNTTNIGLILIDLLIFKFSKEIKEENINLIEQIIQFAKFCFRKDPKEGQVHLNFCENLLSMIEVIQMILIEKCDVHINLDDFSNGNNLRYIRDQLIEKDYFKIAIQISTRTRIESEPVWSSWALSLLKLGKYKKAREKFKYCNSLPNENKQRLLNTILNVLEGTPSLLELKRLMNETKLNLKTHMTEEKFNECRYYLQQFGTKEDHVEFLLRYSKIEICFSFLIHHDLSKSFYCNSLLSFCINNNLIDSLLSYFKNDWLNENLDQSNFKRIQPWLIYSCKYLSEKKKFKVLLKFQEFMKDNIRSSLTCIHLFKNEKLFDKKLNYLQLSLKYFKESLNEKESDFLKKVEIKKYINLIELQIEILKSFKKDLNSIQNESFNLFSSLKSKKEIIEKLFYFNSNLSIRIIVELKFNLTKITLDFLKQNYRDSRLINDILKNLKPYLSEKEWDFLLFSFVTFVSNEKDDKNYALKFVYLLINDLNKVQAYLICDQFKQAYLIAKKGNSFQQMSIVMSKSMEMMHFKEAKEIYDLSSTYLENNEL
eukprot:gene345-6759_t